MPDDNTWDLLLARMDAAYADIEALVAKAEQAQAPAELLFTLQHEIKPCRGELEACKLVTSGLRQLSPAERQAQGWKLAPEDWDEILPEFVRSLERARASWTSKHQQWLDAASEES